MEKQEKSSKKQQKSSNRKRSINNTLMHIEEYKKIKEIIRKESEVNKKIHSFEEDLLENFNDIIVATEEYTEKLKNISEKFKSDEKSNNGKIYNILYDLLKDTITSMIKVSKEFKKQDCTNIYEDYKQKFDKSNDLFDEKMKMLDDTKAAYFEEIKKYEQYLVKKELGLIENNNETDGNKKEKKKKDKNKNLNDNYIKVKEHQENYIALKEDLIKDIKEIFGCLNTERKFIYYDVVQNCDSFFKVIKKCVEHLAKTFTNQTELINTNTFVENTNVVKEDKIKNIIEKELDISFYGFKFLHHKKEDVSEEDKKHKKKKKEESEIDTLSEKLTEENINNIINEIKKRGIKFSKENDEIVEVIFDNKKYIDSTIVSIINNPDNFSEEEKTHLKSLFEKNVENQNSFMRYLNNYRAKGSFSFKKKTIEILCELFIQILESAVKSNNFKMIQFAMILSLTYYYINEEENNKKDDNHDNQNTIQETIDDKNKIYMTFYIKKSSVIKEKNYWINYLNALLDDENEKVNKRKEKMNEKQKTVAVYSSIFTLVKNIVDYDLEFEFINNVLIDIFNLYTIDDKEKKEITDYLMLEFSQKEQRNKNKDNNK